MTDTARCQSCGMPLGPGFHGTEANAAESPDYCTFCYQNGAFTQSDITVSQMVDSSVSFMVGNLKFEEAKAREMSEAVIPHLKRWAR